MDKELKNCDLKKCIEKIVKEYWYDTITLLDCVLTDDPLDPEYSANTVFSRLEEIVTFQKLYYKNEILNVADLLLKNGYSNKDIKILMKKRIDEDSRHRH